MAMDKFAFKSLPPDTRVMEMLCSSVDQANYNKEIGNVVNGASGNGKADEH
jgi:hypothetical protein